MKQLTVIQGRCGLFENINNFNKCIIVRQVIIHTRAEGKHEKTFSLNV